MPPRIPSEADFSPISSALPHKLHFPSPPESTTSILILFHGLGDHEMPFAAFARSISLPGVLAISVRGTAPLPAALVAGAGAGGRNFHWGDDLRVDTSTGDIDPDPGFDRASRLVMERLVKETLVDRCGWQMDDIFFFGFGQGGSLALGLASRLRTVERIVDISDGDDVAGRQIGEECKGVVSIGGPLPSSMVPSSSRRERSGTPVLVCQLDDDEAGAVEREFKDVRVVNWKRKDVAMPRDRDEMFPIMKFLADQLNKGFA
ncbi:hypothetical protein Trco_001076 [Trichoderma cornu-damae]|uniref:Phospholipase/carboxylesterase/thioesterase domain-containing protein n=1 Tax=Trichoderma cornu-damae TaxID=654480 RepID=A0A9P8QTB6_9HYPO|nr:hypothetical protein Trco_001076 [Trichoderma cornu-damae]